MEATGERRSKMISKISGSRISSVGMARVCSRIEISVLEVRLVGDDAHAFTVRSRHLGEVVIDT